jgi:hypothetical protein
MQVMFVSRRSIAAPPRRSVALPGQQLASLPAAKDQDFKSCALPHLRPPRTQRQ